MGEATFWASVSLMVGGAALGLIAMAVMVTTWRQTKPYALQRAVGLMVISACGLVLAGALVGVADMLGRVAE